MPACSRGLSEATPLDVRNERPDPGRGRSFNVRRRQERMFYHREHRAHREGFPIARSVLSVFSVVKKPPSFLTKSNPQRRAESTGGVIRLGAVVIDEDLAVTAVAEEGAAEFPDVGRGLDPA